MDHVQAAIESILFMDAHVPRNSSTNTAAGCVHSTFWGDAHGKNLCVQGMEIEMRLGVFKNGRFDTNIKRDVFETVVSALSGYTMWSAQQYSTDVVSYHDTVDASLRVLTDDSGARSAYSKQKVSTTDLQGVDVPFDFRLAVSIEMQLDPDSLSLERATRVVTRQRHSFSLNNVRYDLSRITHQTGVVEHQVELELINMAELQLSTQSAQELTIELQDRLVDLIRLVEPVDKFTTRLLKKRKF